MRNIDGSLGHSLSEARGWGSDWTGVSNACLWNLAMVRTLVKVRGHHSRRGADGRKDCGRWKGKMVEVPVSQMVPVPFDKGAM